MNAIRWLDFSSAEREDVLNLLAAQQDKSTQDELGVGLVRDAIADHLFPPLNTIQTRAKYFLFVPWILRALERGSVGAERLAGTLRNREIKLIGALLDAADKKGLIGAESREQTKRLPSSIYWTGVRRMGIYTGGVSLAEYLAELPDTRAIRKNRELDAEYAEAEDSPGAGLGWDTGLPADEADFLTQTDFALQPQHARYLKEKILAMPTATGRSCLLQWMVCHLDTQAVADLDEPWSLLHASATRPALPEHMRRELTHARNFSLCARVLTAVYFRLLVVSRRDQDTTVVDDILWDSLQALRTTSDELAAWYEDLPAFWLWVHRSNSRLQRDRPFIEEWLEVLAGHGFAPHSAGALITAPLHRWIQQRERRLKGDLARMSNPPVLQRWKAPDALAPMDFRWRTAKQIVHDILQGLQHPEVPTHA